MPSPVTDIISGRKSESRWRGIEPGTFGSRLRRATDCATPLGYQDEVEDNFKVWRGMDFTSTRDKILSSQGAHNALTICFTIYKKCLLILIYKVFSRFYTCI